MVETSPRFLACMPFILREEGGYSNDPNDPGGMTMHGIIQREYDKYRRSKGLPAQWVEKISVDEQNEIYWTDYWLPHCPELATGLDLSFFNIAVNGGQLEATRLLQRALGITADGIWGGITDLAVRGADNIGELIDAFANDEEKFYRGLTKFQYFGRGWIARAERCRTASLNMYWQSK
jgi:lysozyme family protein